MYWLLLISALFILILSVVEYIKRKKEEQKALSYERRRDFTLFLFIANISP